MVWALALVEALLLTSAGPGFQSLPVSSLAGITGMKLILRKEIRLLFYTNAQMSNVYVENWKDHKKG